MPARARGWCRVVGHLTIGSKLSFDTRPQRVIRGIDGLGKSRNRPRHLVFRLAHPALCRQLPVRARRGSRRGPAGIFLIAADLELIDDAPQGGCTTSETYQIRIRKSDRRLHTSGYGASPRYEPLRPKAKRMTTASVPPALAVLGPRQVSHPALVSGPVRCAIPFPRQAFGDWRRVRPRYRRVAWNGGRTWHRTGNGSWRNRSRWNRAWSRNRPRRWNRGRHRAGGRNGNRNTPRQKTPAHFSQNPYRPAHADQPPEEAASSQLSQKALRVRPGGALPPISTLGDPIM